ncbi:MAG: hypothetical protein JWQ89_4015 [Devosia sp.]|uniref:hypothetical protein n=1 Tax=Devosia sp. TaxID=1871048 RepID=UPI00260B5B14|nr:hypothetical protein [Devosia sp.]MDB5542288.1 hypothetical protein [Devosia sp.]
MNKLALAALAIAMLTSSTVLPTLAQSERESREHFCDDELGYLRPVSPAEVLGIDVEHRVWVTEICPRSHFMRSDGNAAHVRGAIRSNAVLVRALQRKGYFSDDVFAVQMMGENTINLYVHRFAF